MKIIDQPRISKVKWEKEWFQFEKQKKTKKGKTSLAPKRQQEDETEQDKLCPYGISFFIPIWYHTYIFVIIFFDGYYIKRLNMGQPVHIHP